MTTYFTQQLMKLFEVKRKSDGTRYSQGDVLRGTKGVLTRGSLWKLRKGQTVNPSYESIRALANFFNVSPAYFFERNDEDEGEGNKVVLLEEENLDVETLPSRIVLVNDPITRDVLLSLLPYLKKMQTKFQPDRKTESEKPVKHAQPVASRPYMPGYGIQDENSGKGLLPWSWADERLSKARTYWMATTRPEGRPHLVPIWGVWLDDHFFFSTAKDSRKALNLAGNPACSISMKQGDEAVIVEGKVEEVSDPETIQRFIQAYGPKYSWDMQEFSEPVFALRPTAAFAFLSGEGDFTATATRWVWK